MAMLGCPLVLRRPLRICRGKYRQRFVSLVNVASTALIPLIFCPFLSFVRPPLTKPIFEPLDFIILAIARNPRPLEVLTIKHCQVRRDDRFCRANVLYETPSSMSSQMWLTNIDADTVAQCSSCQHLPHQSNK